MIKNRMAIIAGATALVLAAGGGAAYAASVTIPDSAGVIHGCYKPTSNGGVSPLGVIDTALPGGTCPKGQRALTWNQTGPQGPAGPQGPPGPGTAGLGGLNVIIVRATNGPPPVLNGTVTAECPADHPYLLGGGGDAANHQSPVKFSAPIVGGLEPGTGPESASSPNGWYVGLEDQSVVAYAWAICSA